MELLNQKRKSREINPVLFFSEEGISRDKKLVKECQPGLHVRSPCNVQ
jgi:hypothetical protein